MSDTIPSAVSVRALLIGAVPALVIGVGSALVLRALDLVSEDLQHFLWDTLPGYFGATEETPWWIFLVLTLTGAAVGAIVWLVPGHGGPDSATTELGGPPPKLGAVPTILLVAILGLAGGVSLGPENPTIAVNSALAVALLGRLSRRVPPAFLVLLAVSGTIGALFATPVAAALVLTGTVGALAMPGTLWDKLCLPLASAGAGAVTMILVGGEPIAFELTPMGEYQWIYLLQGVLVAGVSALLGIAAAFVFPYLHRAFHALRNPLIFTTLGGMILGVLGIIGGPITLFKGLAQTADLLEHPGDYSAPELALFTAVKIVALLIAASAGFRGGRIFPAVFVGTAFGLLAYALIPGIPISLAVACGVMGIILAATRDGWIALFVGVVLTGDIAVLPLMCLIIFPVWLLVTKAPELVVHPRQEQDTREAA
ncbi:ion channel protein [Microbacterium sp. 4R-513]|uniref:ion channel protein n=1 Tax=Microbacterium sp. 4R-513 TaxID=2567934 RepID=UPI0013E17FEB|nr:ion channel protein [Microbacterium sp. 4R-513]QIG39086.1 ion channel protein [Microbacterium sp. 4R-513]